MNYFLPLTPLGVNKTWELHEKLPAGPLRDLFSRFLDITTPPTRQLLTFLATCCDDTNDEERLTVLANVSEQIIINAPTQDYFTEMKFYLHRIQLDTKIGNIQNILIF